METQQLRAIAVVPGSSPTRLVKTQIAGLSSRDSELVGLGWGLGMSISNKFRGDAGAADPGIMPENYSGRDTGSVTLEFRRGSLLRGLDWTRRLSCRAWELELKGTAPEAVQVGAEFLSWNSVAEREVSLDQSGGCLLQTKLGR